MKRFLIALGSVVVVASAAFVIIRFLKNESGEGGDDFDCECDCEE